MLLPRPLRRRFSSLPSPPLHSPPLPLDSLSSLIRTRFNPRTAKFNYLLSSVISLPSILSLSLTSLYSRSHPSLSHPLPSPLLPLHFSLAPLSLHLRLSSLPFPLIPSRENARGNFLALPLKLTLESLRLTLECIYSPRRATFAYSGRHVAVRYVKSYVRNPTWWFRVAIQCQPFTSRHVSRLLDVLACKVDDPPLLALIQDLFESDSVSIELGGTQLGRGFPQESSLAATLVNIYFDRFDREMQSIRAEVHKQNPRLKEEDLNNCDNNSRVLHHPVRVYAVRYLDEILIATSGSKSLIVSIKDRILDILEGELGLKIDKFGCSIHSAVSEKIEFLGFEFQAVPPSVLHPPMSEKAIRARKKYLKRKAEMAQELKNARETRRKKLGLKILNLLIEKMKRGLVFEFDFRIEREVREIFKNWASDTLEEYFRVLENRRHWHRFLTTGDFLKLEHIRAQLPAQLIESYDQFQEEVDKYLSPIKTIKSLEEKERLENEEEKKSYDRKIIKDLTELKIKVNAPIELIRKMVRLAGFTNSMGRPRPIEILICLEDSDIIKWYAGVGKKWLDFFCCCHNFKTVKTIVNYHLRFSCILTLAEKHKLTKKQVISRYSKDLRVRNKDGLEEVWFPREREIKMMGDKNLSNPKPVDCALTMILVRLAIDEPGKFNCSTHFCERRDTVLYRVRLLQNRLNLDPLINEQNWVPRLGSIHESLNNKCLPFCVMHFSDLLLGKITLQEIDCTSFVDID